MTEEEFIKFLKSIFTNLSNASSEGSVHYVCMDWRHIFELMTAGRWIYNDLLNLCVWNKNNGGMGSYYRSKHELVFVFQNGEGKHINNIELGKHGRYRTNVWDYAGVNTFKEDRQSELEMHPTVKPTQMVVDAILDSSEPKGIILDCFGGSGTTLLAAQTTKRIAYLMEIDPKYVDVTIERYMKAFQQEAINAETGLSYTEIKTREGL